MLFNHTPPTETEKLELVLDFLDDVQTIHHNESKAKLLFTNFGIPSDEAEIYLGLYDMMRGQK